MSPVVHHDSLHPDVRVLSTLNNDGSRRWLRPRVSEGKFLTRRRIAAYVLILIFAALPYFRMNGKPLVLLDVTTRHFTLFGSTFLPTDTLLLALLLVSVFVAIFLLTALLGRVWCGWACPQTVYMEFVFRPIERLFDGSPGRTRTGRLAGKAYSTPLKYAMYFAVSLFLSHIFLAYFVGIDNLRVWVTRSPLQHPTSFLVMVAVTGLMLLDFTFFREQVCLILCPYGRFQSALLDRQSLVVSYDRTRGEPRGKRVTGDLSLKVIDQAAPRTSDCVDCNMCVTTCPTGIDIRNGLQMECINCTQCIDACNAVMTKLKRPLGLIRYSSQARISGETPHILRPRVIIYPIVLLIAITAFMIVLFNRSPVDITILRGVGRPFIELPGELVANPVKLKFVNRSEHEADFNIVLSGVQGVSLKIDENPIHLKPGEFKTFPAMFVIPAKQYVDGGPPLTVMITQVKAASGTPEFHTTAKFRLMGPGSVNRRHEESEKDTKEDQEHSR